MVLRDCPCEDPLGKISGLWRDAVDDPVQKQRHVTIFQEIEKTVAIPQIQCMEKPVLDCIPQEGVQNNAEEQRVYKTHSGGILDTPADLKEKADIDLSDLCKAEANRKHNFLRC